MKTTVDIPDSLLAAVKEFAAQRRTTLKALVEQGLRQVLHRGPRPGEFQLRDARIAALCLHHGVSELWTADRDFTRFPALRTHNPLVG